MSDTQPTYFATPEEFRAWLEEHHQTADELVVGFYKVKSGIPSMTWSQAVDEALCFGWIDGRGGRIDDQRHTIRFTPRRKGSNWSKVNVNKVQKLLEEGRMRPAGIAAYEARSQEKTGVYSFEQDEDPAFSDAFEQQFRANATAWEFFERQAPWYRRTATHWVMSAKRQDTRERRMSTLIDDSAAGLPIRMLDRNNVRSRDAGA